MKHILVFDLPEEREELKTTMNAGDMASAIEDFSQLLRSKTKHGDPDEVISWGDLRDKWHQILEDNEVQR
jgi:hypothetical protein